MREFKFRAWFTKAKALVPVDTLEFFNSPDGHAMVYAKTDFEKGGWYTPLREGTQRKTVIGDSKEQVPRVIVMQFTGLKDKNGREIYEGDIIRILDDEEFDGWNEEVIFHRSCFMAGDDNLLVNVHFRSIVKGNVYENPELLEGDAK